MNAETKREIERRAREMPPLTDEQAKVLIERIKKHREKHGKLNYTRFRGLIGLFGLGRWRSPE